MVMPYTVRLNKCKISGISIAISFNFIVTASFTAPVITAEAMLTTPVDITTADYLLYYCIHSKP